MSLSAKEAISPSTKTSAPLTTRMVYSFVNSTTTASWPNRSTKKISSRCHAAANADDQNGELVEGTVSSFLRAHQQHFLSAWKPEQLLKTSWIAIKTNAAATETFNRFREHLEANGLKLNVDQAILGAGPCK